MKFLKLILCAFILSSVAGAHEKSERLTEEDLKGLPPGTTSASIEIEDAKIFSSITGEILAEQTLLFNVSSYIGADITARDGENAFIAVASNIISLCITKIKLYKEHDIINSEAKFRSYTIDEVVSAENGVMAKGSCTVRN